MTIDVSPVPPEEVLPLRELYRREMDCQIVHRLLARTGLGDLFLLRLDGRVAGYGFVMGVSGTSRGRLVTEFYVLPALSRLGAAAVPPAHRGEPGHGGSRPSRTTSSSRSCSTTAPSEITSDTRRLPRRPDDEPRPSPGPSSARSPRRTRSGSSSTEVEPIGDWLVEVDGAIVATGGLALPLQPSPTATSSWRWTSRTAAAATAAT